MDERYYKTTREAVDQFPNDTFYNFIDIMLVRIDEDGIGWMLLRDGGGMYWNRQEDNLNLEKITGSDA